MLSATQRGPDSTGRTPRHPRPIRSGTPVWGRRRSPVPWFCALSVGALLLGSVLLGSACRSPQRPAPPPPPRPDTPAHELAASDLDVIPLRSGPPLLGPYLEQYPLGNLGRRKDLLASNDARSLHLLQLSLALPPHQHPSRKTLAYVLTGRGRIVIDGREYPAAPGAAFRVDPGVLHSMHPNDGDTLVSLVYYEPPLLDADGDDSVAAE